jgi:hypothetical protein
MIQLTVTSFGIIKDISVDVAQGYGIGKPASMMSQTNN